MLDYAWKLYWNTEFILSSETKKEAEWAFRELQHALPKKYGNTHIEWQGCLFGPGARGDIVKNSKNEISVLGEPPVESVMLYSSILLLEQYTTAFGIPKDLLENLEMRECFDDKILEAKKRLFKGGRRRKRFIVENQVDDLIPYSQEWWDYHTIPSKRMRD